jgi:hypothetical protein
MATNTRKGSAPTRKTGAAPAVPKPAALASQPQPAVEQPVGNDSSAQRNELDQSMDLEQRIAERAYQIYLERGGTGGDPISDWLQAEAEIRGSQRELDENKDRAAHPPEKKSKGKAMDKEQQQFYGKSAGGI